MACLPASGAGIGADNGWLVVVGIGGVEFFPNVLKWGERLLNTLPKKVKEFLITLKFHKIDQRLAKIQSKGREITAVRTVRPTNKRDCILKSVF